MAVPPFERVIARAVALVVGAAVSVVSPTAIEAIEGVSAPPKPITALTEIFWEVTGRAWIAVVVNSAAVLAVVASVAFVHAPPV